MHIFQARAMAAAASRAPSQLARRDALSLTVSAPRLTAVGVSDFLSNSRSGDAADWQVACGSMLWQRRFVSSLELRRARPADGDTSAVCGPRASAMRPRRVAVGYRPRERSANDARYGCSTVYHHSGCDCESAEWQRKTLKMLVCGRMDRCIRQYLKQYVSAGPCNTSYGP